MKWLSTQRKISDQLHPPGEQYPEMLFRDNTHFKISELARHLGLDRSTTYRILLSLEQAGFVEKDEETGTYSLGLAAFEIGNAYLMQTDLIQVSKPIMADLALKPRRLSILLS